MHRQALHLHSLSLEHGPSCWGHSQWGLATVDPPWPFRGSVQSQPPHPPPSALASYSVGREGQQWERQQQGIPERSPTSSWHMNLCTASKNNSGRCACVCGRTSRPYLPSTLTQMPKISVISLQCLDWGGELALVSLWLDPTEAPLQHDNSSV